MAQLFIDVGYVNAGENSAQEQQTLANIWEMLGGRSDGEGFIFLHNVKVIMCAVLNFHIDWMIDYDRSDLNTT